MSELPSSASVLVDRGGRPRPLDRLASRSQGHRRARRRQDRSGRRRVRHRLRRRPQQLLPAGHGRADGRVRGDLGVRPRGVPLPRLGLHRARPGRAGARPRRGPRAPPAHRLRLRADHGRGRRRRAHARAVPRLARQGPHGLPARAPRRLRVQQGVDARPGRQGARRGRADRRGRRGHRLRARRQRRRDHRAHERGRRRRRAGRRRRRAVDRRALGDARAAGHARRPPAGRRRGARRAHVDLLVPAGGRVGLRPGGSSRPPTASCRPSCTSTRTRRCTPTTAR